MLEGQRPRALVAGAPAGIGRAFSEEFGRKGYDLVIVALRADCLEELSAALKEAGGIEAEGLMADLASADGAGDVTSRIMHGTRIDMVVNNAGYTVRGGTSELDPNELREC